MDPNQPARRQGRWQRERLRVQVCAGRVRHARQGEAAGAHAGASAAVRRNRRLGEEEPARRGEGGRPRLQRVPRPRHAPVRRVPKERPRPRHPEQEPEPPVEDARCHALGKQAALSERPVRQGIMVRMVGLDAGDHRRSARPRESGIRMGEHARARAAAHRRGSPPGP